MPHAPNYTDTRFAVPLAWEAIIVGHKTLGDEWEASTPLGDYKIMVSKGEFGWVLRGLTNWNPCTTLEAAKREAQDDYEGRVRSMVRPELLERADLILRADGVVPAFDLDSLCCEVRLDWKETKEGCFEAAFAEQPSGRADEAVVYLDPEDSRWYAGVAGYYSAGLETREEAFEAAERSVRRVVDRRIGHALRTIAALRLEPATKTADGTGSSPATFVDEVSGFRPGDPAPGGYVERAEWAKEQLKAGLKQTRCEACGLWKFPQEPCDKDTSSTRKGDEA